MADEYLIVTIKHGYVGDCVVFWAPDRCGYTSHVDRAGRYSKEEADDICRGHESECWALPAEAVEAAARKVLFAGDQWQLKQEHVLAPRAHAADDGR